MGRFVRVVLLVLATLVPVGASAGPPEDVAAALERWASAFNANDVESLLKLYTPDAVLVGTTGSTLIEGQDGIRKYFSRLEKSGDKVSIGIRKTDQELLGKINTSLAKLKANGALDKILDKWGLKAKGA